MKHHIYLFLWASFMLSFPLLGQLSNNVELPTSINTTGNAPDASAILDVQSTSKGMLVPRMTSAQRLNVNSPAKGLLVFDYDLAQFWFFDGTNWRPVNEPDLDWTQTADGIYHNTGNVAINTSAINANANLYVNQGNFGEAAAGIYSFRFGSNVASNGGTSWNETDVDAAIKGTSVIGNNYSAAVYGASGLNHDNSAAVLGTQINTDVYGALGYNDGNNVLAGYFNGDARFVNGNVGIGGNPNDDYMLCVHNASSNASPGKSAIFAHSGTSLTPTDGGDGWPVTQVNAAISGVSLIGYNYTAGIHGSSPLAYTNSAAIIGLQSDASIFGALAFKDDSDDLWAGYFDGQVRIKQQQSGRAISFENHNDNNYWTLGISAVTDNLYFFYNDVLMSSIRDSDGVYVVNSDRSLKTNIEYLGNVLPKITQLKPAKYHYKTSVDNAPQKSHGFIAQEVQQIFPELVHEHEDGKLALAYDDFAILSIQAIKEQQEIIENQNAKIESQEQKNIELEQSVNEMKAELQAIKAILSNK